MQEKTRSYMYAENEHLRENSCLLKGQPPTVARALAPFPAHLPSPSHPFDSKVTHFLTRAALTPSTLHLEDSWQGPTTL